MTVRVLLVDDQVLVRSGFKLLIDSEPGLVVVGEADDGEAAVALTKELRPQVVLMDIRMPGMDGIAATGIISADEELNDVKVVVLTTFGHDEYVFGALQAGASGFLMKDTVPAELVAAVKTVAMGDSLLLPERTRHLIEEFVRRDESVPESHAPELDVLSPRERDVLAVVGRGLSNNEIAETLVLSPLTVKTHVSRILTKLNARDRAQLVMIAYESGLLTPGT
ncbi:response regulator transcription factor [Streptomyces sp. NBC_01210]|uniref:response regulator transcription factor n=1 Tax=Streptomyces sp. NBC_01210 TaxID=2903774 RepID=UPI002E0EAEEE|nr:response regulator transcription factor [Streptomyces sp. NBC_01210]